MESLMRFWNMAGWMGLGAQNLCTWEKQVAEQPACSSSTLLLLRVLGLLVNGPGGGMGARLARALSPVRGAVQPARQCTGCWRETSSGRIGVGFWCLVHWLQ